MRGVLLGPLTATAVPASGMWIIRMFRGVFPIRILLLGVGFLIGRPVPESLEWRVRADERDLQEGISAQLQSAPAGRSAGVPSTPRATTRATSTSTGGTTATARIQARPRKAAANSSSVSSLGPPAQPR